MQRSIRFQAARAASAVILLAAVLAALGGCGGGSGGTDGTLGASDPALLQASSTAGPNAASRLANPACIAGERPELADNTSGPAIKLTRAFPALAFEAPVGLWQAPGNAGRWYVAEKGGVIHTFVNEEAVSATSVFADLRNRVSAEAPEAGLLGVAFHPRFAENGQVFISYTAAGPGDGTPLISRLSRFISKDGGKTLDVASEQIVLSVNQPNEYHNGGHIAFGLDGKLVIGFGDGGMPDDQTGNAQNPDVLLGKLLRIDVDAATPYASPAGNAYPNGNGGRAEIFASGFRNPWRWSIDRANGDIWLGEVGQGAREEINRISVGKNYGWPKREGSSCYPAGSTACVAGGLTDPVAEYGHANGRCAVTGGFVYRGKAVPELEGQYLYSDFCTGEIWSIDPSATSAPSLDATPIHAGGQIMAVSFAEANDGQLYVLGYMPGQIFRIDSGATATGKFPRALSQTGCFDATRPGVPASGVRYYDVNVPFWSDGAAKERFFAIPDGTRLGHGDDRQLTFPVGSVVIKNIRASNRLVETRLLMRHTDGEWGGYSYEWNAAQTDATLVVGGKTRTINHQTWRFPAQSECMRCHTAAAGRIVGAETPQTSKPITHSATGALVNQLEHWFNMGYLDARPETRAALPNIADTTQPLESRARAWLHSNCSYCHRPSGGTPAALDLRFETTLAATRTCNAPPSAGSLGIAGARIIVPGDPAKSVLLQRMRTLDTATRMPPLGSYVVDAEGVKLLEDWIGSLKNCP